MNDANARARALCLSRGQSLHLEDRIDLIERVLIDMIAPICCGQTSAYNEATGQFVCERCLATVGQV